MTCEIYLFNKIKEFKQQFINFPPPQKKTFKILIFGFVLNNTEL